MEVSSKKSDAFAGILSVFPPLIQVIGAMSLSLLNIIGAEKYFVAPELLSLVNFFLIFVVIGSIGVVWYWHKTPMLQLQPKDKNNPNAGFYDKNFSFLRNTFLVSVVSMAVFIFTALINVTQEELGSTGLWIGISQYISYSSFIVSTGIGIFAFVSNYVKKETSYKPEDFTWNLTRTLQLMGHGQPDIKVYSITQVVIPQTKMLGSSVQMSIDGTNYTVLARFDGLEVYSVSERSISRND